MSRDEPPDSVIASTRARDAASRRRRRPLWTFWLMLLGGVAALVLAVTASVSFGSAAIPFSEVWSIVMRRLAADPGAIALTARDAIVWDLRLPRALLAVLVGAGLAMAGAVMQGVTRNGLADPHLLGVSAGAAFGANLAILVTGDIAGPFTVSWFAFLGALGATALVIGVAGLSRAADATRLVLAGVAVSFVISAGANVLIMMADPRAIANVVFWMMGGLGLARWDNLALPAGAVLAAGMVFMLCARQLNALAMGDETAATLGVRVIRLRLGLLVVNAFLTGVVVAFSGMIGFVGLMTPHIARLLTGGDNRRVLPLAALLGGVFLALADVAARTIARPNDIPIGVITGVVGGLFFIYLMARRS